MPKWMRDFADLCTEGHLGALAMRSAGRSQKPTVARLCNHDMREPDGSMVSEFSDVARCSKCGREWRLTVICGADGKPKSLWMARHAPL